jgi:hypothetical protein
LRRHTRWHPSTGPRGSRLPVRHGIFSHLTAARGAYQSTTYSACHTHPWLTTAHTWHTQSELVTFRGTMLLRRISRHLEKTGIRFRRRPMPGTRRTPMGSTSATTGHAGSSLVGSAQCSPPDPFRLLPRRALCAGIQTVWPRRKRCFSAACFAGCPRCNAVQAKRTRRKGQCALDALRRKEGESANWLVASRRQVRIRGNGEGTPQRRGEDSSRPAVMRGRGIAPQRVLR